MTGRGPAERLDCATSPGNQATTTGRHIGLNVDNFDRLPYSDATSAANGSASPAAPARDTHSSATATSNIQQIRRALHAAPGRQYPPGPLVITVAAAVHQSFPSYLDAPRAHRLDTLVGHQRIGIHTRQSIGDSGCHALRHCWPVLKPAGALVRGVAAGQASLLG
ncbi:hypothetical protein [Streptomyces mutomycini]|uniref:Uncharacterized protein n=1 Tax=Streptomyces mutomycini TaxID=284036 RepID=A0ABW0B9D4_9ACTN|nr:hypothetical protein [Streptomyces mutomycini]